MKISDGLYVDHINGDRLDNRKANLRAATTFENRWNTQKVKGKYSSKYKGVKWNKQHKRWIAQIIAKGKVRYHGCFTDEIEAAKAYDQAAKKHHGQFAVLNFKS